MMPGHQALPAATSRFPPTWEAALHDAGVGKRLAGGLGTRTRRVRALQPLVDLALCTLPRRLLDDLATGRRCVCVRHGM